MVEIKSASHETIDQVPPPASIPFEVANFKPIEVDLAESSDAEANKGLSNSGHQTSSSASSRSPAAQNVGQTSAVNQELPGSIDKQGDNPAGHHTHSGSGGLRPGQQIGHAFNQLRRTFTLSKKSPKEASPDVVAATTLRHSRSLGESKKGTPSAANTSAAAIARGVTNTFQYVVKQVKKGAEGVNKKAADNRGDKADDQEATKENTNKTMGKVSQQGRTVLAQGFGEAGGVVRIGDEEHITLATPIMITKCSNTVFEIAKKCNKLEIDSCKNCRITFPAVISSVDMQNSESCEVFCTSGCPGVNLDSVTSCRVHIPRSAVEGINISSSGGGSAAIVVTKPEEEEDTGDMDEYQVPFQYVHKFKDGALVSEVSPLYYH